MRSRKKASQGILCSVLSYSIEESQQSLFQALQNTASVPSSLDDLRSSSVAVEQAFQLTNPSYSSFRKTHDSEPTWNTLKRNRHGAGGKNHHPLTLGLVNPSHHIVGKRSKSNDLSRLQTIETTYKCRPLASFQNQCNIWRPERKQISTALVQIPG